MEKKAGSGEMQEVGIDDKNIAWFILGVSMSQVRVLQLRQSYEEVLNRE